MKYLKISPALHPIKEGESWWIVHPNQGNVEFCIPVGACAVCTKDFYHFISGIVYEVTSVDCKKGWITVSSESYVSEMPFYVFARNFDAEAFVRGVPTKREEELMQSAKPFSYLPTLRYAPIDPEFKDEMSLYPDPKELEE